MCNLYTQSKSVDEVARIFRDLQMPLSFPEGLPNLSPRDIAITESAPIVVTRRAGEQGQQELIARIALKRLGTPDDIAYGVLFFASDYANWITGQVISIDGGK